MANIKIINLFDHPRLGVLAVAEDGEVYKRGEEKVKVNGEDMLKDGWVLAYQENLRPEIPEEE